MAAGVAGGRGRVLGAVRDVDGCGVLESSLVQMGACVPVSAPDACRRIVLAAADLSRPAAACIRLLQGV